MIKPPSTSDLYALCDWAELQAWGSQRGACTQGDLVKYLEIDDVKEDDDSPDFRESEKDEARANDVLGIALRRSRILGVRYPFVVTAQQSLRRIAGRSSYYPLRRHEGYLFNLCFSALRAESLTLLARHYFELESKEVMRQFFGGKCFHFGWSVLNARLGKAEGRIGAFCEAAGGLWKMRETMDQGIKKNNDIGIDAVVWKQPPDGRENALMVVGQCASGANWEQKLASNASLLLADCFEHVPAGPIINCFCTSYQIPEDIWRRTARSHNGILFDRLRMVLLMSAGTGALQHSSSRTWLDARLQQLPKHMRLLRIAVPRRIRR